MGSFWRLSLVNLLKFWRCTVLSSSTPMDLGPRMLRGGKIQQALAIEVPPEHGGHFNSFEILMQVPSCPANLARQTRDNPGG
eukprot:scaffold280969_cov53-Prasinocladus_malaysianus.AAC.1